MAAVARRFPGGHGAPLIQVDLADLMMSIRSILRRGSPVLACVLAIAAHAEDFGSRVPSAQEIEDALAMPVVRERGVSVSSAAPQRTSISMQIKFEFGSDRIDPDSLVSLQNLAEALKSEALQERQFELVGHTDGVGSRHYNIALSGRRASAVRDCLLRYGIEAGRLKVAGKGPDALLNKDDPAAAENRRVEIVVLN